MSERSAGAMRAASKFWGVMVNPGNTVVVRDLAEIIDKETGQAELIEALELATYEINAINARDGAPQHIAWHKGQPIQTDGCTHEWWAELLEKCNAALAKARGEKTS